MLKKDIHSFSAVIFDLDGVITQTALVHSSAWKNMFDSYLRERETHYGEPFEEFTHENDYLKYVDGKPRYEGVRSFLESRAIKIPFGNPSDDVRCETICGLGNRKNDAFNEVLAREGVKTYPSTVKFMLELKAAGIHVGVASSSRNCQAALEKAGLTDLVETRVDGIVSAESGLPGKPEPDIFLAACRNLGAEPWQAVVVEDATSGVAAGKKGNFGLVIGIARENNEQALLIHGADIVCSDLNEISLDTLNEWFLKDLNEDNWKITYHDYQPETEKTRESLLTVGNGYFGTRGAMEEAKANTINYPGTYIAGLYNRLTTKIAGKDIENEDLVNCPNWLPIHFSIENDKWLDINKTEIVQIKRELNLKTGLLKRDLTLKDDSGRMTRVVSERFASMDDPHLAALRYSITPLNYSGQIHIRSGIDGDLINAGVERYKNLNQNHLQVFVTQSDENQLHLIAQTTRSSIHIATAVRHRIFINHLESHQVFTIEEDNAAISSNYDIYANQNDTITLEKIAAFFTSKPDDTPEPALMARESLRTRKGFDDFLKHSVGAWKSIWEEIDIQIKGDRLSQKLLRAHMYHLMCSMSPHNSDIDTSITARGLHGEAYRGHIFWDELFILPFYNLHFPKVAKSMLKYRFRRLGKAKEYAKEYGYKGAMFPWQSGSDGREETQVIHLNPLNGQWDPDHSSLQRHVSLAIAYNIYTYWNTTADLQFMSDYGAEMFLEICRFWASKSVYNKESGRYDIHNVMGPDEFHEHYAGALEGGITNNAYTNLMVAWMLEKVPDIIKKTGYAEVSQNELKHWQDISTRLAIEIDQEGIIAQFKGYFNLKELDWEGYRKKYGNIHRMDRILKAEGLSPDEYKVAKQADTLMIFYNLEKHEVDRIFTRLGYKLPEDYLQRNLDYYFLRTSHGSTLSRVVHAHLASLAGDQNLSWELYMQALTSDYYDIQGGTTGEGIHAGVMASTIIIALKTFAGLQLNNSRPAINPRLPSNWKQMEFQVQYKGHNYRFSIEPKVE
ncbi:MAG: beta-phosphoglucomutase family hydrolase [Bacteroidales bacterium]